MPQDSTKNESGRVILYRPSKQADRALKKISEKISMPVSGILDMLVIRHLIDIVAGTDQ